MLATLRLGASRRAAGLRRASSNAITKALTPPSQPPVDLPPEHAEQLDGLYNALTAPLPRMPTQREKVEWMRRVDTSSNAFFAHRSRDADGYAHLIRCLGVQGELARAHDAFDEMEAQGIRPDGRVFAALMDACARAGDVDAADAVLRRTREAGVPLSAPLFTGLIGATRRSGAAGATEGAAARAEAVLARMRSMGVPEDAPTHTSLICAYVDERQPAEAWRVWDDMRAHGVKPDAVSFTAVMVACAQADQLEQAGALLLDMKQSGVEPTLATHNAYINVCAARCASLALLDKQSRLQLSRLQLDVSTAVPLRLAFARLELLSDTGHAPDEHTYHALLRACAGAGEVPRAQRVLTRMLDTDVAPHAGHFHALLRACVRGQRTQPNTSHEAHLQVALAVPPSMVSLGVPVQRQTLDLVLSAHTAANRVNRSLSLFLELYSSHSHAPGERACELMLSMARRLRRPKLAREVLQTMGELGIEPTEEQAALPGRLEDPPEYSAYPRLPAAAWSARRGAFVPDVSPATARAWTRRREPVDARRAALGPAREEPSMLPGE